MDPIEDIFAAMHLQSALYARIAIQAPWGISFEPIAPARFGMVVTGDCWLNADSLTEPLALHSGDCFIVNTRVPFSLQDSLGSPLTPCDRVFPHAETRINTFSDPKGATDIIIGRFIFDGAGGEPLMSILPPVMHISAQHSPTHLLQSTLQMIELETARKELGSHSVVTRLADVLFIQAVRCWSSQRHEENSGWLAAWMDRRLNPALQAMHSDLAHHWTVAELASIASMSRSAFAVHFKTTVGYAPLEYLIRWRIWRSKCLLRHPHLSLQEVAERIGYETAPAFNRAFKQTTGITPGQFRLASRHEPDLTNYDPANNS